MAQPALESRLPIETERLLLRPFAPDDLEALYAYQSRSDVARYLYWEARSIDEVRTSLGLKIASTRLTAEGDALSLAVVLTTTGEMIGDFILMNLSEEHRSAEIGFIIHPDDHGRGYATEAGRAVLGVAFEDYGLHRVIGRTEARNAASARVLQKLGMRQEAHLVENEFVKGEWQSELGFAILDREWHGSVRRGGAPG
jgi:RimJ/RimL family protein N-acetyltransferase